MVRQLWKSKQMCKENEFQTAIAWITAIPGTVKLKHNKWQTNSNNSTGIHTYTSVLRPSGLCPGLPEWAGTRKVKPIWILLKQDLSYMDGYQQITLSISLYLPVCGMCYCSPACWSVVPWMPEMEPCIVSEQCLCVTALMQQYRPGRQNAYLCMRH